MPEALPFATLTVLGGALKGAHVVIDDAVDDVLIGSDPDCRLFLDAPGVSPIHARLWLDADGAVLHDTRSPAGLWVNDDRVNEKHGLKDGDIVWLGEPGGPDSVMIQFRSFVEGASAAPPEPTPEPYVAPAPLAPSPVAVPPAEWVIEEEASIASPIPGYAPEGESLLEDVLEASAPVAPPATPPPAIPYEPQTSTFDPAPDTFDPGPAFAEPATPEPEANPFDDAIVIDEPAVAAAAPPPPIAAVARAEPAEEFFIEESEPPAASEPAFATSPAVDLASPSPDSPLPPEAVFAEPEEPVFGEPAIEAPAVPHVEEEFFFDVPAPATRAPATDTFFIEEPADEPSAPAASADSAAFGGDEGWSAASEPLHLPVEAPPPAPAPAAAAAPTLVPPAAAEPAAAVVEKLTSPAPAAEPPRRPRPTAARPAARPAPRPAPASAGGGAMKWIVIAVAVLAVLGAAAFFLLGQGRTPRIASVEPARARAGERIAIVGEHFNADAAQNAVSFGGGTAGKVVSASPTRIEVEVPALPVTGEGKVPVVVTAGGKASTPFELAVYKAPRVHGISPSVAMPGEEVTLAGVDWGPGAIVRFGDLPAAVLDVSPTSIRVRVPDVTDPVGTSLPVVVSMGGDPSNQAPFVIGKIPLVLAVDPAGVSPGQIITIKGRGFPLQPALSDLKIGGVGALVVSAFDNELKAIVPWAPPGDAPLELRVPRSENVGAASMTIAPRTDPVEFTFVAGPIRDDPGHDHAVLATGLGPAFVLSASGGRSAADRAYEAQQRLAEAAAALKASLTADIEVRDLEGNPALGLTGKPEPLIEVTAEDAAAYNEDWTGLRGKGGPVTRARLALWWGAVARDLVLLLIRGEKPHFAADLAPEGKVLGQVSDAARKTGKFGLPLEVVEKAPAGWREPLRVVALRVPVAVKGPAGTEPAVAVAEAAPGGPLKLEGIWSGSETETGTRKYVTVTFTNDGGTLTYERALTMSVPIENVQPQKAAVRFSAKSGSRISWYLGKWDGVKLRGTIHADSPTGNEIGTFELDRKR